jgi:hypothetical protein
VPRENNLLARDLDFTGQMGGTPGLHVVEKVCDVGLLALREDDEWYHTDS